LTREAFKSCYDQYFDPLRNYLYYRSGDADLATDLSQEVFTRLWQKQMDLQAKHISALLYKMAGDLFVSHLRKKRVRQKHLESLRFELDTQGPDSDLQYRELKKQYETALAALPDKQRTVFLMNRLDGLTYREIAESLGLSVKAIEKRMRNALGTLRQKLGQSERR
jgi:RNA polymerase sigma-70 factor (family 1)